MYVSQHAQDRLVARLGPRRGSRLIDRLEDWCANTAAMDRVAIEVARLSESAAGAGSNGDTVIAIVRSGLVETVMLRRSSQTTTPATLGVDRVISWCVEAPKPIVKA